MNFRHSGAKFFHTMIVSVLVLFPLFCYRAEALPAIGEKAPDFAIRDLNGREFRLSGTSGEATVVLLFWSTWSGNSPDALKRFEHLYRENRAGDIRIIGINVDGQSLSDHERDEIRRIVMENGITYPILIDEGLRTFRLYNVIALPTTLVISRGTISFVLPGWPPAGVDELFDHLRNPNGPGGRQR